MILLGGKIFYVISSCIFRGVKRLIGSGDQPRGIAPIFRKTRDAE